MIRQVRPGTLRGEAAVPASKSHMQRLLLCAALSGGRTEIAVNGELSDDCRAFLTCLPPLGAQADVREDVIDVSPCPRAARVFSCGESGAALRFLMPVCLATGGGDVLYEGRERPQDALVEALSLHGAYIAHEKGVFRISGTLTSGDFALPGDISSQYVSGLLFALPLLSGDSRIILTTPLVSQGYIDMTLDALSQFGIRFERRENVFFVPGNQAYHSPLTAICEADCSAGAVWAAARAMGHPVVPRGVPSVTRQPDAVIKEWLGQARIDVSSAPDLMPLLAAVAALKTGKTRIEGTKRLSGKESDRPRAMAAALTTLGIACRLDDNRLTIHGGRPRGGRVQGERDHRIVMALALLATKCEEPVEITDAEAVTKSYPSFWRDFDRLWEGNA